MKKYIIAWIKSLSIEFGISYIFFRIIFLNFHIHISRKTHRFALTFPKYGLILTDEEGYTFEMKEYYKYKKKLFGKFRFCICNLKGEEFERRNKNGDSIEYC